MTVFQYSNGALHEMNWPNLPKACAMVHSFLPHFMPVDLCTSIPLVICVHVLLSYPV